MKNTVNTLCLHRRLTKRNSKLAFFSPLFHAVKLKVSCKVSHFLHSVGVSVVMMVGACLILSTLSWSILSQFRAESGVCVRERFPAQPRLQLLSASQRWKFNFHIFPLCQWKMCR